LRTLVTGASGFVGRHLTELAASEGDDLFGTVYPALSWELSSVDMKPYHVDLRKEADVAHLIRTVLPQKVFHLAAVSNVRRSWEERTVAMETNIMGTFFLFEALRKFVPEARVLFVSSADVYGIPAEDRSFLEEDPSFPVNPYAYTKISGELMSRYYSSVENLNIRIARAFPHTGPGQGPDFVCADWADQIARAEAGLSSKVVFVGNLNVSRDYLDVRDVVRGYSLLLSEGRSGETYNICSGRAVHLKDILSRLCSQVSFEPEIRVDEKKLRKTDIPALVGDNAKIKALGWSPAISLDQTLEDLLNDRRRILASG
jgi:GDP-4-dehydro-6-deoxy-D-mannose reductase